MSLPFWSWIAGGLPLYAVLILAFAGFVQSALLILGSVAIAVVLGLFYKVYIVPLVPARRSAWTAYPWRNGQQGQG